MVLNLNKDVNEDEADADDSLETFDEYKFDVEELVRLARLDAAGPEPAFWEAAKRMKQEALLSVFYLFPMFIYYQELSMKNETSAN
jgi:hypothetical protein